MTNRLRGAIAASQITRETIMNIKQMKSALSTFRAADVSIIKDDATRAQAQKLQAKQKGFTLLELLIVITLIAVLATAALTAYNGIGESASDTAAANNLLDAQSSLNNYRAIEAGYPNQWDNLANVDGIDTGGMKILRGTATNAFFGQLTLAAADVAPSTTSVWRAVGNSLNSVGVEELQAVDSTAAFAVGYVPNLALNESYPLTTNPGSEFSVWESDVSGALFDGAAIASTSVGVSIVPSVTLGAGCVLGTGGPSLATDFAAVTVTNNTRLNLINDALDSEICSLVIAVGFGKDVPGSTSGDKVEIAQVPTLGTNNVNPSTEYARAIALFHLGTDDNEDGVIDATEILNKARLIGVVDPEGRTRDEVIAAANAAG